MAAGKNKLTRYLRMFVGGHDLSGDVRTVGGFDYSAPEVDMTGLSNFVGNYLAGHRQVGVRGFQAYQNDASAGASDVLQNQVKTSHVLTAFLGSANYPVAGDMAYIMPGVQLSDAAEFGAGAGMFTTDFLLSASSADANYKTPWGVALFPQTSFSSTTNGTSINLGAGGTSGGHAALHITGSGGGNYAFTIQHSTTGAWAGEESTLLTFAADGSAHTAEWKSVSGTVRQYVRGVATRTSGVVVMCMAFAINR